MPALSKRAGSLGTENAFVVLAEVNALIGEPDWAAFEVGPAVRIAVVPWQNASIGLDEQGKPADGQSMTEWGYWIVVVGADGAARLHEVVTRTEQPC